MPDVYNKMKKQRGIHIDNLRDTTYGAILVSEPETSFTLTLSADGIVTKNKYISLWPFTFIINEIPLPTRRYSESVILGGVLPALKHPSNKLFESVLNIIL